MTVDAVERVREVRERLVTAGTVVGPNGRSWAPFPVAIGNKEGLALLSWVREEGAQRTLETGLGYAISTLFLFEGLRERLGREACGRRPVTVREPADPPDDVRGRRTSNPGGGGRARARRVLCRGVAGRATAAAH
jgi:hypothetical protein